MNDSLIRDALGLIQHYPTDMTLRGGLLANGYAPGVIDRHLDYMVEERLATVVSSPNQPAIWRLKLWGKEVIDRMDRPPIGFALN